MDALPTRYLPRKEKDAKGVEHELPALEPVPEHLESLIPSDLKGKLQVDRPKKTDAPAVKPGKTKEQ